MHPFTLIERIRRPLTVLHFLFTRRIWQADVLGDRSLRGRCFAVLRVISMTWTGLFENNLASRAGALSYSSMLGLGPLVALAVLFSGIVLERADPDFAIKELNRALVFIAPQLKHLQEAPSPNAAQDGGEASATEAEFAGNPELITLLNKFIEGSQSKAIGLVGALALIFIVIQLFSSIENAFNEIWGVRRGRNWMLRIVFYWTAVTLGAVLAFASISLLTAGTFVKVIENLPMGTEIRHLLVWVAPLVSLGVLVGLLTVFYRFIPNTSVGWWPSLIGALVAVASLYLNNLLAFLYFGNVLRSKSLYGSLGLLIVLMLGLYMFWLFLLVGGQITYAVQNANYRSSRRAWVDLNYASREGIALLVLTIIARRFRGCQSAYSVPQISELVRIPTQILNACLGRLTDLGLVSRIPPEDSKSAQDYLYQPARPLERIRLSEFRSLFQGLGEGPGEEVLGSIDPIVREYHQKVREAIQRALGEESLESLIVRLPTGAAQVAQPA